MPSPVGHALVGIAAGWAVARPAPRGRALAMQMAALTLLATVADLDLLWHRHRMETHSLGAAVIFATLAAWRAWPVAAGRGRIWCAAFAAWATHPLCDALSFDQAPPLGVMLFWPFSLRWVQTGLEVFLPVSRSIWSPTFPAYTARVLLRELLILLPVMVLVWAWRGRSRGAPAPR